MSLSNLVKHDTKKDKFSWLTPRLIAVALTLVGALLAVVCFDPLRRVFSGELILNQYIYRVELEEISLYFWTIPMEDILIRAYSLLMLGGFFAAFFLAIYLAKRNYLATSLVDRLSIGILVFGLLGARLFYFLFHLDLYEGVWWEIFFLFEGGLAIFGGIMAATLYIWSYCRKYKFNFYELGDVFVPALLLGQIIGRWGNFFNYEAYGQPTNVFWKMFVPDAARVANLYDYTNPLTTFFHPTFLYEIIPAFFLLIFIMWFYNRMTYKRSGIVLATYLIGYGTIRSITEFFRLDAEKILLGDGIPVPKFIVNLVDFVTSDSMVFIVQWVEEAVILQHILVNQILAIAMIVIGIVMIKKRSEIFFFKKEMRESK